MAYPQQPTTVTSEENLLGLVEDRTRFWAEDITVHEWAHAIENLGFDDDARTKWRDLFDRARAAGLWPGTFAMAVDEGREFFAELSQSFFWSEQRDWRTGGPVRRRSDRHTGQDTGRPRRYLRPVGGEIAPRSLRAHPRANVEVDQSEHQRIGNCQERKATRISDRCAERNEVAAGRMDGGSLPEWNLTWPTG